MPITLAFRVPSKFQLRLCMRKKMLYGYLLLLQVLLAQYCHAQQYRTDSLFHAFKKDVQIELEQRRGTVGSDDETRETYYLLMLTASVEDLVKYTDDSMPAIRAKIFEGLVLKNADKKMLEEILNKHSNDTAKFLSKGGCVEIEWSVKEFMQMLFTYQPDTPSAQPDWKSRIEKIRRERYSLIAGSHHGFIDKDSLLKTDSLIESKGQFRIVSCVLTIRRKPQQLTNRFNARAKRRISRLNPGEPIFIENVKAEGPDKIIRTLPSFFLKVK